MHKDTNFLETISNFLKKNGAISASLISLLRKSSYKVHQDTRSVYSRDQIVQLMVLMKLLGIPSLHKALNEYFAPFIAMGKDVFYSVRNNVHINWRRALLNQASAFCEAHLNAAEKPASMHQTPCLILDDTTQHKTGKFIEFIGRVFNTVLKKHVLGFKVVHLALWTGKNTLHLDFSMHIEVGKRKNQGMKASELKARYKKERPANCPSSQRVKELTMTKISSAIKMLKRAVKKGVKPSYLLADSWYFCTELLTACRGLKMDLITRAKANNWLYEYKDKDYTIEQLRRKVTSPKNRKRSRKYKLYYAKVRVHFQGIPIAIHFFKERYRGSKWQYLISSNTSLHSNDVYALYQNRWAIEVSFKELKQLLDYGKCQARDFDAHIADTTQCLLAYNYLSHLQMTHEHLTIGGLFSEISQSWVKPTLMQRLWTAFFEALQKIALKLKVSVEQLLENVIQDDDFMLAIRKFAFPLTTET